MTPQIFFCWDLSLLQVLRRYLLWNLSEYELVICRPVCRILGTKFVIMKPIVTFFFCQNLLFDKVTWWLNNNCLFCLPLCFAYCYHRLRDHLLLKPWKISEIPISKRLYKKVSHWCKILWQSSQPFRSWYVPPNISGITHGRNLKLPLVQVE